MKPPKSRNIAAKQIDKKCIRRKSIKRPHAKRIAKLGNSPDKQRYIQHPDERTYRQLWKDEIDNHRYTRHTTRNDLGLDKKQTQPNRSHKAADCNHQVIKNDVQFL